MPDYISIFYLGLFLAVVGAGIKVYEEINRPKKRIDIFRELQKDPNYQALKQMYVEKANVIILKDKEY